MDRRPAAGPLPPRIPVTVSPRPRGGRAGNLQPWCKSPGPAGPWPTAAGRARGCGKVPLARREGAAGPRCNTTMPACAGRPWDGPGRGAARARCHRRACAVLRTRGGVGALGMQEESRQWKNDNRFRRADSVKEAYYATKVESMEQVPAAPLVCGAHIACISIHVHVYTATRAHRHTIACMSCGDARVHLTERGERPDGCECYAISGACQGVSLHRRGSFGCAHGMRCIAMQVIHLLLEQDAELIEQRSYQDQLPFSESSCGQVCASVRACMSSGVCAHVCVRAFQLSRRHAVLP